MQATATTFAGFIEVLVVSSSTWWSTAVQPAKLAANLLVTDSTCQSVWRRDSDGLVSDNVVSRDSDKHQHLYKPVPVDIGIPTATSPALDIAACA